MTGVAIEVQTVNTSYVYTVRRGQKLIKYTVFEYSNLESHSVTYLVYDAKGNVVRNMPDVIESFKQTMRSLS